jgi:hypothetical protein
MSAIKPFQGLDQQVKNKLATRKWTSRFLRAVLGKLNITGKGVKLTQTGNGHLHFELEDGAANSDYVFKISAVDGGFRIAPGLVYSSSSGWQTPRVGGSFLTGAQPPVLSWSQDVAIICLVAKFDVYGMAIETPWSINAFGALPVDVPLFRANGVSPTPQPGTYHILIGSRSGGVIYQWVRHNIIANMQWEELFVWG